MVNPWSEISAALSETRALTSALESHATRMAEILAGRLRHVVNASILRRLKKELRDFDAVTGKWKESK